MTEYTILHFFLNMITGGLIVGIVWRLFGSFLK